MNTAVLRNRYRMLPNQRTIQHFPRNVAAQTIAGCARRPWNSRELQSFGQSTGIDTERASFLMPAANVTSVPVNGEKITDDEAVSWTILAVSRELEGAMLRATCIKQS